MLKLSMKKLGTPEREPPKVEGNGGVSADGDTAFAFAPAADFVIDCPFFLCAPPCAWVASVRGGGCCARACGAGTVVTSACVVVVLAPVVLVPVVGRAGSGAGGAGTLVTPSGVDAEASVVVVVVVTVVAVGSASAPLVGVTTAITASEASSAVVSGREIIEFSFRAGS
jgi:hypothetical protein